MYGTVARIRIKPGKEEDLRRLNNQYRDTEIEGMIFEYVYQLDKEANEFMVVVGFESEATYEKNAESPDQHQRYLQMMELLDGEPEWNDGEIVDWLDKRL